MLQLPYGSRRITVIDDPTYSFGSVDNPHTYQRAYTFGEPYISSRHAVRVTEQADEMEEEDEVREIASCILGASGGASGVHDHSALVHDSRLIVAVGSFVVALRLPALDLEWHLQTDWTTCFGVYHSEAHGCYVSHGELDITRISYAGSIDWTRSGADIFTKGFTLTNQRVQAIDWNDRAYAWDIENGQEVPIATK